MAVPWLRRLVAGLSPRRSLFDPGSVHVGFVMDKVALGQVFLRILRVSPINFIPPVLHYIFRLHHRVAQEALRLRCVRSICCGDLHHKKKVFTICFLGPVPAIAMSILVGKYRTRTNTNLYLFSKSFIHNPSVACKCALENIFTVLNAWESNFSLVCCLLQQIQHQPTVKISRNLRVEFFATVSCHFLFWIYIISRISVTGSLF
jgi:hypothetical protein